MSTYHNTYLSNFKENQEEIQKRRTIEDFKFFDIYFTTLLSTFRWNGDIPTDLPPFMIEYFYQMCGRIVAFMDGNKFTILPAFPSGSLLKYGEFDKYTGYDMSGKTYELNKDDIVIGFNNSMKIPYYYMVKNFAEKSSYALRAVDTALRRASRGAVLTGFSPEQLKTIGSMLGDDKTLKEFNAIPAETGLDPEVIKRLPIYDNRETDVIALWDVYTRYRNLYYSTFGINNVEIQKKERLTEAEGSGNDEIVRYSLLNDMVFNRRKFKDDVAKKFNKNIDFDIERDSVTVYELLKSNDQKISDMEIMITRGSNIVKGGQNVESKIE